LAANEIKQAKGRVVGQIGSQLYTTFFLFDNAISNPDWYRVYDYEQMVLTDETIAAGLDFMIMSVLNKLDRYVNETDKKLESFVNDALEQMQDSLPLYVRDILSALWAGYSATEIVWKASGAYIVPDYLATYHPRTILFNVDRETGRLLKDGVTQFRWFAGSPVIIPTDKVIIYTHNKKFGNPYGESQLKRIRKNWVLKDPLLKMWINAMDKYGTPLLAALINDPDAEFPDPENPEQLVSNLVYSARLLANVQNGTGIVLAHGEAGEKPTDIKALAGGGQGMADGFFNTVTYLNKMMLRGLLVPSLIFDEGQRSGSYALGQAHFDIYQMMLDSIYKQVTEVLLEQFIRRMIELNFGPQKDYGSFPEKEINETDRKLLSDIFYQMTNAGYLDPTTQEDFDHVRERMGIPPRKVASPPDPSQAAKIMGRYNHYVRGDGDPPDETQNMVPENGPV
jgi:hypothetical protein